ncbi:MAG: hypothetical protein L6R35_003731 [Caloplaca aegaea]|nr:MAG: hypothetical protein L6R35_003731 [Caloplaca aegaea]
MAPSTASLEDFHSYILVTGANGGLGYSICCRLIDEFLRTRPSSHSLRLIITTRDKTKSHDTIAKLKDHIFRARRQHKIHEQSPLVAKIYLQAEQVDLCNLRAVQNLAKKLLHALPKLDTIILNAGLGGFAGVDWVLVAWTILTNFPKSVTYPTFKLHHVGQVTGPQETIFSASAGGRQPELGTVFCSNVFGHYMLVHGIAPLLSNSTATPGRVVWVGTLEAYSSVFSTSDIQALKSSSAYESSKRLTDVLALSSSLVSTQPFVRKFLPPPRDHRPPKQYVTHPGICATNMVPLNWILFYLMTAVFYFARWVGSPWHTVTPYKGACAPVWVALASQEELDGLEENEGTGKWGSGTNFQGEERVTRTEVQGWGLGGTVGDNVGLPKRKRPREAEDLTEEGREQFELLGRECWELMERLREEWEGLLGDDD